MNRPILLIFIILVSNSHLFGQNLVSPNKPVQHFNTEPGYVTINEFSGGPGLGIVDAPFSKYFVGFTTIHGYQINKNFITAAGTGFSIYNGGNLIPVFIDLRYKFFNSTFTPYILGDGGVLFNPEGGTKLFVNPVAGLMYTVNKKVGINFGAGLFVQKGDEIRDSYVNFRLGVTFMPMAKKDHPKSNISGRKKNEVQTGQRNLQRKSPSTSAVNTVKKTDTEPAIVEKPIEKTDPNLSKAQTIPVKTESTPALVSQNSVNVKPESETKKADTLSTKPPIPEIKKEDTSKPAVQVTPGKKDVIVYRVQFESNSKSKGPVKITIAGKVYDTFEYLFSGAYRSTVGEFSTKASATEFQKVVRQSGYPQAFVVVFKNNVRSTDPALLK
jgi:hypothetical protein